LIFTINANHQIMINSLKANGCPSQVKNISQKHLIPWSKQLTCFHAPLGISIRCFQPFTSEPVVKMS